MPRPVNSVDNCKPTLAACVYSWLENVGHCKSARMYLTTTIEFDSQGKMHEADRISIYWGDRNLGSRWFYSCDSISLIFNETCLKISAPLTIVEAAFLAGAIPSSWMDHQWMFIADMTDPDSFNKLYDFITLFI